VQRWRVTRRDSWLAERFLDSPLRNRRRWPSAGFRLCLVQLDQSAWVVHLGCAGAPGTGIPRTRGGGTCSPPACRCSALGRTCPACARVLDRGVGPGRPDGQRSARSGGCARPWAAPPGWTPAPGWAAGAMRPPPLRGVQPIVRLSACPGHPCAHPPARCLALPATAVVYQQAPAAPVPAGVAVDRSPILTAVPAGLRRMGRLRLRRPRWRGGRDGPIRAYACALARARPSPVASTGLRATSRSDPVALVDAAKIAMTGLIAHPSGAGVPQALLTGAAARFGVQRPALGCSGTMSRRLFEVWQ
jgi:hypothetical protein